MNAVLHSKERWNLGTRSITGDLLWGLQRGTNFVRRLIEANFLIYNFKKTKVMIDSLALFSSPKCQNVGQDGGVDC